MERLTTERLEELRGRAVNPAPKTHRYIAHIRGTSVFEEHCMASELLEIRHENDVLRGLLAKGEKDCVYCGLPAADISKCRSGFPGCARMDDMMAAPTLVAAKVERPWTAENLGLTEPPKEVLQLEVYAWVGRDEYGSGVFGLKQGQVPAGLIPMVAIDQQKLDKYWDNAEMQALLHGQRIYLVKLIFAKVVRETQHGD